MAERRKRVGIFNHAKYSEPVLRQISNTLHQKVCILVFIKVNLRSLFRDQVNNDIQSLLKNNGINSVSETKLMFCTTNVELHE